MADLFTYLSEEKPEKKPEIRSVNNYDIIFSVHEITMKIKGTLEPEYSDIWVEGEISNYKKHSSGHHYFSLKDDKAVISCVIWRSTGEKLDFEPDNGQKVKVQGGISVYEGSGRYQIDVKKILISGIGSLQIQFEALKQKLLDEGLFEQAHKKRLPYFVKNIGVVTAETGAAFQDIKKVIRSRAPYINIYIYNARVQGKGTETEIVSGIEYFNNHPGLAEVIIIGRGGGSLEDLWTFNEETVARAIYASTIPVISAVGHEVDFSISDFTADVRAATPSQAAEIVSINSKDEIHKIVQYESRIVNLINSYLNYQKEVLKGIENCHAFKMPADLLKNYYLVLDNYEDHFYSLFSQKIENEKVRVSNFDSMLKSLNPEAVLKRGYAIVKDKFTSEIITSSKKTIQNQELEIKFKDGIISAISKK